MRAGGAPSSPLAGETPSGCSGRRLRVRRPGDDSLPRLPAGTRWRIWFPGARRECRAHARDRLVANAARARRRRGRRACERSSRSCSCRASRCASSGGPSSSSSNNDAYRPILGASSTPRRMARAGPPRASTRCGAIVGPLFHAVYAGGRGGPGRYYAAASRLNRNGYLEECYFSALVQDPIADAAAGKVAAGLLGRRQRDDRPGLLRARLRTLRGSRERALDRVGAEGSRAREHGARAKPGGCPFRPSFYVNRARPGGGARLVARQGLDVGSAAAPPFVDLRAVSDIGWPLAADAAFHPQRAGRPAALRRSSPGRARLPPSR